MARLLNRKQMRFVSEYLIDGNATQAALRAGYSRNGVGQTGHNLLNHPEIRKSIDEKQRRILEKIEITPEKVIRDIEEVRRLATAEGEWGPALRASELLGRTIALFADRVEASGRDGGPIMLGDVDRAARIAGILGRAMKRKTEDA